MSCGAAPTGNGVTDNPAPSPGVIDEALATIEVLNYQGAFKLPDNIFGESSVNYSYGAIGFNVNNNSLFIAGHAEERALAEFPIPVIVNSTDINAINMASAPIQDFVNAVE